ncbi:MAG: M20/M25/M40 family metallo-hydrolase [Clostridia bacterium]|nr:M20/M25/M40 family metallo-hydrolase [Clostridia bacterium]
MEQKELLFALSEKMSVVGFEYYDEEALTALIAPYFDEHEYDTIGNHIFIRRCGKENAPRVLVDAHYDEIGLMVKSITDEGFLHICNLGGVDTRILPAAELVVYGKEKIPGIVLTKPRELMTKEEKKKLVPMEELLVDIGMTKEEAEIAAPIGTPVGFEPVCTELKTGYLAGKGFDNKCSAAAVFDALTSLDMKTLSCDLYFSLSGREEVGHRAISSAVYRIRPDLALVLDVTFGNAPGSEKICSSDMRSGPVVSLTATLDTDLTDFILETAKKHDIPVQSVVEAMSTSTHADDIYLAAGGVPTALISIPVWFMHTANEMVHPDDMKASAALVAAVIRDKYGIAEEKEEA